MTLKQIPSLTKKIVICLCTLFLFNLQSKSQGCIRHLSKTGKDEVKYSQRNIGQMSASLKQQIDSIFLFLKNEYEVSIDLAFVDVNDAFFNQRTKTIYLGIPMMQAVERVGGAGAVAFVICHEFAHYGQSIFPNGNELVDGTARVSELQADLIGAYMLSNIVRRKIIEFDEDRNLMQLVSVIFNLGDTYFNTPQHHGSYLERTITAMLAGVSVLTEGENLCWEDIFLKTNSVYTSHGIEACQVDPFWRGPKIPTGLVAIGNEKTGEYTLIAADFLIYVSFVIINGEHKGGIADWKAIGKLDRAGQQIVDNSIPAMGYYIQMFDNYPSYPKRFFVCDKDVYTDHTMREKIPYLIGQASPPPVK